MITRVLYCPLALALIVIRLPLLVGLISLRMFCTFLFTAQSPITASLSRIYLLSCGVFIATNGEVTKGKLFE
jgi:hypothetical protein